MKDKPDRTEITRDTLTAGKGLEILIKEFWSILEAASEKKTPSQYLGERAIRAIQGKG
ncbi:MAG: hypothetical protein JXA93_12055 [Anaerolineae bacterium]|nr:hypothetical protein [Anaerolineae bacterium]